MTIRTTATGYRYNGARMPSIPGSTRTIEEMVEGSSYIDDLIRQIAEREADGRLPPKGPWASDPGPEVAPRTRIIALHIEGWTIDNIAKRVEGDRDTVATILRSAGR